MKWAWSGILHVAVLVAAASLGAGTATAASFNCNKAATSIEVTVCSDPHLSELDEVLARRYAEAKKRSSDVAALGQAQRSWLSQRNSCQNVSCLVEAYKKRLAELAPSPLPAIELPEDASSGVTADQSRTSVSDDQQIGESTPPPAMETAIPQQQMADPGLETPTPPAQTSLASSIDNTQENTDNIFTTMGVNWQDYLPKDESIDDYYQRHPVFVRNVTLYVLIAGLITLFLMRPPLMGWYRSQILIFQGSGPVDLLLRSFSG